MKLIDLFAGIGGFSLAAHWMNWQTIAFVEKDEFCQKVLRKNFGEVPVYGDIREFDGKPFRGTCDIITGGFPCQPFSQAGQQKGSADERHLFPAMLRVISEVRPTYVVAENVRGLLSVEHGETFEDICSSLESLGYSVQPFIVPACAVNAPHRRDRIWFIAHTTQRIRGEITQPDERESRPQNYQANTAENAGYRDASRKTNQEKPIGQIEKRNAVKLERSVQGNGIGLTSNSDKSERQFLCGQETESQKSGDSNNSTQSQFTPNARSFRRENCISGRKSDKTENSSNRSPQFNGWQRNWFEVATEFCRMDARISNRVDRLRSLGNSIVPQIAYEIFQAIETVENN